MATAILAPIIRRGLFAISAEAVVDAVGSAGHRIDHAIGPNVGAGIKIRRPKIVEIGPVRGVSVPVMVPDLQFGSD